MTSSPSSSSWSDLSRPARQLHHLFLPCAAAHTHARAHTSVHARSTERKETPDTACTWEVNLLLRAPRRPPNIPALTHSLTDRSLYLIRADYSLTMNGRRSSGFSPLNYHTGVKAGSLKGCTLYPLFVRTTGDAGRHYQSCKLARKIK